MEKTGTTKALVLRLNKLEMLCQSQQHGFLGYNGEIYCSQAQESNFIRCSYGERVGNRYKCNAPPTTDVSWEARYIQWRREDNE